MLTETIIWSELSPAEQAALLRRPALLDDQEISAQAAQIIAPVRRDGDVALVDFTAQFEGRELASLKVSGQEFADAEALRLRLGDTVATEPVQ